MKTLFTVLAMVILSSNLNAQDTTNVRQIQLNLDKYYQQHRTGTGLFAFGVALSTITLVAMDRNPDLKEVRTGMYAVSAGAAITGLLIQMEAARYIRDAAEIRLSPTSVTLKF